MAKLLTYTAFQDIKNDLSKSDLIDIIETALKNDDIEEAMKDFLISQYSTEDLKDWCKDGDTQGLYR